MLLISEAIRSFKRAYRLRQARNEVERRFRTAAAARPHGLPGMLVVSLTSYASRFATLTLTLRSLVRQTVAADKIILWIDAGDYDKLPKEVTDLVDSRFEIAMTPNLRSYTKIVPTLRAYPDAFIATFDDDVYYEANCLEQLVAAFDPESPAIICHRAHEIELGPDGSPVRYDDWTINTWQRIRSPLMFPTGVSGVLYPPGIFHADTCDEQIFLKLCPTSDDVWLYWMWRLNGHVALKIGDRVRVLEWPGSQSKRLQSINRENGGNDQAIRAMVERYGFPKP
jgi:hypothetical protein